MMGSLIKTSLFIKAEPTSFIADKIAPWLPPACRAKKLLNTEFLKGIYAMFEELLSLLSESILGVYMHVYA